MWLNKFEIPYMASKEGYVSSSDVAQSGVVYDEQYFFRIMGVKLGHSSMIIYVNKGSLVAAKLNEVSDKFLNVTKLLGQIYGVDYKGIKSLHSNSYLYLF